MKSAAAAPFSPRRAANRPAIHLQSLPNGTAKQTGPPMASFRQGDAAPRWFCQTGASARKIACFGVR